MGRRRPLETQPATFGVHAAGRVEGGIPVAEICRELEIAETAFYRCMREFPSETHSPHRFLSAKTVFVGSEQRFRSSSASTANIRKVMRSAPVVALPILGPSRPTQGEPLSETISGRMTVSGLWPTPRWATLETGGGRSPGKGPEWLVARDMGQRLLQL